MKNIIISILVFFFIGCGTLGHQEFCTQSSPTKYPKTDHVYVFHYGKVDLNKMYNLYFSDFLKISISSFNGPFEDSKGSGSFAKSSGVDVLISTSQHTETYDIHMSSLVPDTKTTSFSGSTTSFGLKRSKGVHN